jgi:hypothetical protein
MQLVHPALKVWPQRIWSVARNLLAAGFFLTAIGWYVSYRTASQLAVETQDLSRVNQFQDTGIAVDQAFAEMNDAAAAGTSLNAEKLKLNQAVRAHASQADALRHVVPSTQIDEYLVRIDAFRAAMNETKDATHLGKRITAFSDMKVARDRIVAAAKAS